MSASTNMGHVTSFEAWETETAREQKILLEGGVSFLFCPDCSLSVLVIKMYPCLYCDIWRCANCAGEHFGETKAAFLERKAKECQ